MPFVSLCVGQQRFRPHSQPPQGSLPCMSSDRMRLRAACPALPSGSLGRIGRPASPPPLPPSVALRTGGSWLWAHAYCRRFEIGSWLGRHVCGHVLKGDRKSRQASAYVAVRNGSGDHRPQTHRSSAVKRSGISRYLLTEAAPEAKRAAAVVTQIRWRCLSSLAVS